MKRNQRIREIVALILVITGIVLLYTVLQIGCPIKFLTGVACAGCGMTRAYAALFQLHIADAFTYHPLFWCVPVVLLFYIFRDRFRPKTRRVVLILTIVAFVAVYAVRLIDPGDVIVTVELQEGLIGRVLCGIFG